MKKLILIVLVLITVVSCAKLKPKYKIVNIEKLQNKNIILLNKRYYTGDYGHLNFEFLAKVDNDTVSLKLNTMDENFYIWSNFEQGDTIRFRKEYK